MPARDPEQRRKVQRVYRERHRDRIREAKRLRYQQQREHIHALARKRWERMGSPSRREHHLKQRYGINLKQYDALLEQQKNQCAICGAIPQRALDVDHDHGTGKIRGLVCRRCNGLLGYLERCGAPVAAQAMNYLKRWED